MRRYNSDIFRPTFYINSQEYFKKMDFAELPPEPVPDYWNKPFAHYPLPKDPYKNNHTFFTKDPLDRFVRFENFNDLPNDFGETPISIPQKSKSDKTAQEILDDIVKENKEFYATLMQEAEQNVTYQDEINQAIDEVKSQDLSQNEIDMQDNSVNEAVPTPDQSDTMGNPTNQEPASNSETQEIVQEQMPLANEQPMEDGAMQQQSLEEIVQEEQGMVEDGVFAPEYFGL